MLNTKQFWHEIEARLKANMPTDSIHLKSSDIQGFLGCNGRTQSGVSFTITRDNGSFIQLCSVEEIPALVKAISVFFEIQPLCRYTGTRGITFEWRKGLKEKELQKLRDKYAAYNLSDFQWLTY